MPLPLHIPLRAHRRRLGNFESIGVSLRVQERPGSLKARLLGSLVFRIAYEQLFIGGRALGEITPTIGQLPLLEPGFCSNPRRIGLASVSPTKDASPAERAEAPRLYRVLQEVRDAVHTGTHSWATIEAEAMTELERHGWRPDYITVRRRADLLPPKDDDRELVVLGAARLGTPRLLDNLELTI